MRLFSNQEFVVKSVFFVGSAGFAAWLSFFYLYLREQVGFSGTQIGTISSIQQFNTIIVLPVWGMLADNFGRKKVFLIAALFTIILFFLFPSFNEFLLFAVFIFIFTWFYNPLVTLLDSIALDFVEESGTSSYGEIRLWSSIGWAMSTVLVGSFVSTENLKIIFPVSSILMAVVWIITYSFYKPLTTKKSLVSLEFKHLKELILIDKRLTVFLFIIMFYGIFSAPVHLFINIYYNEIGGGYNHVGIAFAVQAVCEIPFFFYGKKIVKRFGARRVVIFTMLIASIRMFLYSQTSNPWIAIIIGMTHGICLALFLVSVIEYIHSFIPPQWRATGQSFIYVFYFGAGIGLGNIWAGHLTDTINMKNAMLLESMSVIILVMVTMAVFYLMKHHHKNNH